MTNIYFESSVPTINNFELNQWAEGGVNYITQNELELEKTIYFAVLHVKPDYSDQRTIYVPIMHGELLSNGTLYNTGRSFRTQFGTNWFPVAAGIMGKQAIRLEEGRHKLPVSGPGVVANNVSYEVMVIQHGDRMIHVPQKESTLLSFWDGYFAQSIGESNFFIR